ncbi:MAG: hypothetical protein ACP5FR_00270 [Candidatus Micrarchaeia archaeon]
MPVDNTKDISHVSPAGREELNGFVKFQLEEQLKGSGIVIDQKGMQRILGMPDEAKIGFIEALTQLGGLENKMSKANSTIQNSDFRKTLISTVLNSDIDYHKVEKEFIEMTYGIVDSSNNAPLNMYKVHSEELKTLDNDIDMYEIIGGKRYSTYEAFSMYEYFFDLGITPLKEQVSNAFIGMLFLKKGFTLISSMSPQDGVSGTVSPENPNIAKINPNEIKDFWDLIKVISHEYMHVLQNTNLLPGIKEGPFGNITKPKELEAEFLGIINGLATVEEYYPGKRNAYIENIESRRNELKQSYKSGKITEKELNYLFGIEAAMGLIEKYGSIDNIIVQVRHIYHDYDDPIRKIYELGSAELSSAQN